MALCILSLAFFSVVTSLPFLFDPDDGICFPGAAAAAAMRLGRAALPCLMYIQLCTYTLDETLMYISVQTFILWNVAQNALSALQGGKVCVLL